MSPRSRIRSLASIARALRHRNYRLFFTGQGISLVGTWVTRIATSWLVYRLTGSALLLGVVGFAGQIPALVLAPIAGVIVDRGNKHRILLATQLLSMLQSLALAVLAIPGLITVTEIILLQLFQGVIQAFDTPTRQAFVVEMLDDPVDLPNAIALNSMLVNLSRIIGPSLGGILIAVIGEGWCFGLDAVSYLAVVGCLLAMRLTQQDRVRATTSLTEEFLEGLQYVSRFPPARAVLLLLALLAIMGTPYRVLMPAIAEQVFHGGPHTFGALMTATGVGALLGAAYLAARPSVRGLWRVLTRSAAVLGGSLVLFALSRSFAVSLVLLALVGAGLMVALAAVNTILQTIVEQRLRGRVMAFYAVAFLGAAPIGSLMAGILADRIGATATILLGGVACLAGAGLFKLLLPGLIPHIREVYAERGVGP